MRPNILDLLMNIARQANMPDPNNPDVVGNIVNGSQTVTDPDLQWLPPMTPEDPIGFPGNQPISQMKPQPAGQITPLTPAQPGVVARNTTTPTQPTTTSTNPNVKGYENYLDIFKNTLPDEPQPETKRRKQLATVAAINALGQALKQVVDYTGNVRHGAPINPQNDPTTLQALSQYEKLDQEYKNRKDRYDLTKMNTLQEAFKYAYGDEKQREQYENQLNLLGKQNEYMTGREEQQSANEIAKLGEANKLVTERDKTQQGYDLDKIQKQYENESKLIGQRNQDALDLVKERYGLQSAAKAATQLASKSLQVVDEDPDKPVTIPPQIYLDILQKQIGLQNQDFTEFLTSTDFNATNNAGDIMVARYWKDFYTPVYDAEGNVVSFQSKGAQYGDVGGGSQGTPSWFTEEEPAAKDEPVK
jgi:hypothetical protein